MKNKPSKFKAGDIVEIAHYGHPIFHMKSDWDQLYKTGMVDTPKPNNLLTEDDTTYWYDLRPDLVGKQSKVNGSYFDLYGGSDEKSKHKYSLEIASWFQEDNLKLVDHEERRNP